MLPDEFSIKLTLRPKQLLVTPFVVLLMVGGLYLPWGAASAPAWVQAVGSIGAIIGAVVIAGRQHAIAAERLEADRKERESALSKRLAFFALEFEQILSKVVQDHWSIGIHEADQRSAFVFESMLNRINNGFDDDLNPERVALLYEFRIAIAGLAFTLKSTSSISPGDRDEVIATYKALGKKLLDRCTEHAQKHHG